MKPWPHQEELAALGKAVLDKHGLVYFACEERTGKTITALLTAIGAANVLVITKAKAKPDWESVTEALDLPYNVTVTTYHVAYKYTGKCDVIILDESHAYISGYPKRGVIWKQLNVLCAGRKLIYLSATPYAQGPQLLYNQLALSSLSPWRSYTTYYSWFKTYGKPYTIEINGTSIPQYDRVDNERVLAGVEHLFITKTRAELGFDHEPEDQVHYVELGKVTKSAYNALIQHGIVELRAGTLVCDTTTKLRFALHMLEGGALKLNDKYIILANREKVDYILETWGDSDKVAIMYNYIAEGLKLREVFKHASILQATSNAEGVDLSMFEHLVIYSQDFSTARHSQRRARQANKLRSTAITVHFLLVKKGISEQVYNTVSKNKRNYIDSLFKKVKL